MMINGVDNFFDLFRAKARSGFLGLHPMDLRKARKTIYASADAFASSSVWI